AAIQSLAETAPDLILLDMMMPKINGLVAMGLFRQQAGYDKIPIVLMTARAQPHEVKQYIDGGATSVITKPFDPMLLGDRIVQIWEDHDADR
uniref:response regulator n=1 Tax=Propionivibrio sp. TaxID=2212460 RepID=UPI00260EF4BB